MAQYPNMYSVELTKGPAVVQLAQMFLGDALANRIGAIVTENGEAVTLGGSCAGSVVLANGGTVAVSGTVSGNTCYIDLPSAVYTVEGPVEVYVSVTNSGTTTTLVEAFGNVRRTQAGTVIDPGTVIPSVAALIAAIDAAVESIPQDYSTLSNNAVTFRKLLTSSDDIDTMTNPGMYSVTHDDRPNWKPDNWPLDIGGGMIITGPYSATTLRKTQIIFTGYEMLFRAGTSDGGWYDWCAINPGEIDTNMFRFVRRLYDTDDMDTLTKAGMYSVTHDTAANWKPAHWPFASAGGNVVVFGTTGTSLIRRTQLIFKKSELWFRMGTSESTWSAWVCANGRENTREMVLGAEGLTGSLAERLITLEQLNGIHTIPSYYDSYLPTKEATINTLRPSTGDQFVFITDIHLTGYSNGNQKKSHALIDHIMHHTMVRMVVNGGDILSPSPQKDIIDYTFNLRDGVNYSQPDTLADHFFVAGNHDLGANNNVAACLTPTQLARLANLYSPAYQGVVYDPTNPFQYYYDNTESKIRYIFLCIGMDGSSGLSGHTWWDSYAKLAHQCAPFFIDALNSVPDNNYHVVVLNHISGIPLSSPYNKTFADITSTGYINYMYKIFVAYQGKTTWEQGSLSADFTDANGVACCMIFGHQHRDVTGVSSDILSSGTSIGGTIPLFVTTTDNAGGNIDPNVTRTAGTTSEQAFDIFTIDKANRTVYATRIGGGSDRSATY